MLGLDNPIHIVFLLVVALLVFGAKRLPEMGRSLGAGMRGFKESLSGESPQAPPTASPLALASVSEPAPAPADSPAQPTTVSAAAPLEEATPPHAA